MTLEKRQHHVFLETHPFMLGGRAFAIGQIGLPRTDMLGVMSPFLLETTEHSLLEGISGVKGFTT
jgi:hypothetical protein